MTEDWGSILGGAIQDSITGIDSGKISRGSTNIGIFEEMSVKMFWDSYKLKNIASNKIPEAFPISPPVGGADHRYTHTEFEYMFSDFGTQIDDGVNALETVQEMLVIFEGLQLIMNSLFPTKTNNGAYSIEIKDQFEKSKQTVEKGISSINNRLEMLEHNLGKYPTPAIDLGAMKDLKDHLIRIGVEYYNSRTIPYELSNDKNTMITPELVARERDSLENATIQINASQTEAVLYSPEQESSVDFSSHDFARIFKNLNGESDVLRSMR